MGTATHSYSHSVKLIEDTKAILKLTTNKFTQTSNIELVDKQIKDHAKPYKKPWKKQGSKFI